MKIERVINGQKIEIELTKSEMWSAYREQEHLFDMEDIRSAVESIDDDEIPSTLTDEQIDDAACWARGWMDDNVHILDCRWKIIYNAIREVIK